MLKASFGIPDVDGKIVSQEEMISLFDIYCLDAAKDCYLLDPHPEQTSVNCPLLYVCDGKVNFVSSEEQLYKDLKKRVEHVSSTVVDRLPSDVKSLLFDVISSNFTFEDKNPTK
jgi:hypothetical protein